MLENGLCLSLDDKTGSTVQELALRKFIAHPRETFLRNKTAGQTLSFRSSSTHWQSKYRLSSIQDARFV